MTCTMVNRLAPKPAIDIEKSTNGVDADTAPGPLVPVGNTVTWTYLVTNTGNDTLSGVAVTDNHREYGQLPARRRSRPGQP